MLKLPENLKNGRGRGAAKPELCDFLSSSRRAIEEGERGEDCSSKLFLLSRAELGEERPMDLVDG